MVVENTFNSRIQEVSNNKSLSVGLTLSMEKDIEQPELHRETVTQKSKQKKRAL